MRKLQCHTNKTIKLQNVLMGKINFEDEETNLNVIVEKMQSYIQVKGAVQVGPLIQYTRSYVNDKEELDMEIILMLQCNNYLHSVEKPYSMEAVHRVTNCMYCRYAGPEENLSIACDKINVEAFENEIELNGDSYIVFIEDNEEEGTIVADVFMPKKNS